MTLVDNELPVDPYQEWCLDRGYLTDQEKAEHFSEYMEETSGWDGKNFSLNESERHWIKRANEVVEWVKHYQLTGQQQALDAALRCLNGFPRLPGSFTIE